MKAVDQVEYLRVVEFDVAKADQAVRVPGDGGFGALKCLRRGQKKGHTVHSVELGEKLVQKTSLAVVMHVCIDHFRLMGWGLAEKQRPGGKGNQSASHDWGDGHEASRRIQRS